MFAELVAKARREYGLLGFDAIPLIPNRKQPLVKGWQRQLPSEMWDHAPDDANIGLRCGGKLQFAAFDADDKNAAGTSDNVLRHFAGLGLNESDYPQVATPSDSRHFFIRIAELLVGNYCHLSRATGAGEFRYGMGAQIAAPPSQIPKGNYRLIAGNLANLPIISIADLLPLLPPRGDWLQQRGRPIKPIFIEPRTGRTLSQNAEALLRGESLNRFHSRSEAEQALITSLVNTGHGYDSILELFLLYPCAGKFSDIYSKNPDKGREWLLRSVRKAEAWTQAHESYGRRIARNALEWAKSYEWAGRTGAYDRAIFIAHARIAFQCGQVNYAAPCRTLAEMAGVNFLTAANATRRLQALRLIRLEKAAVAYFAAVYRIGELNTLPHREDVRKCIKFEELAHDVFRFQGLGKTAALVWDCLLDNPAPQTSSQIAHQTGRLRETVEKHLVRMQQYGMAAISHLETGEYGWQPNPKANLDDIANRLQVLGIGEEQRRRHQQEREQFKGHFKNFQR